MSSLSSVGKNAVSRSVYVSRLRRAFLLRAHPDRFRGRSESIRKNQAVLLQELSERMNEEDFQYYTSNTAKPNGKYFSYSAAYRPLSFVLEKRDGSLLEKTLQLSKPVEHVLQSLVHALAESGASSFPEPPPTPTMGYPGTNKKTFLNNNNNNNFNASNMAWATSSSSSSSFHNGADTGSDIDHRFDINSFKGRNLQQFLSSVTKSEIQNRRASRMDASAATLIARRLYSFQAIDGIRLGWSSASFAMLVKSLIQLHEEHQSNFHVESFYPLRLVFSPDDYHNPLDLYEGTISLHPGMTQIQWLEALQAVTQDNLEIFQQNRKHLESCTTIVQNELGVKLKKGYSCSSQDYHLFVDRVSKVLQDKKSSLSSFFANDITDITLNKSQLALERILLVVESAQACRRSVATNQGYIRVGTGISSNELISTVQKLSSVARENLSKEQVMQQQCRNLIQQIQWEIGIQKVHKTGIVSQGDFSNALSRLLDQRLVLKRYLTGCSIVISGTGQFCHLSDDGSFVVPCDWR